MRKRLIEKRGRCTYKHHRYIDLGEPKKNKFWVFFSIAAFAIVMMFLIVQDNPFTGRTITEHEDDEYSTPITSFGNDETVQVNFSDEVGVVRDDFYGVNIQRYASSNSLIDADGDCIRDSSTNMAWHENNWEELNVNVLRDFIGVNHHYSNTTDSSGVNFTSNLTKIAYEIKWAYENNKEFILTISRIPEFLADVSDMCFDKNYTCPPTNYTKLSNIYADAVNRVTNNGAYASIVRIQISNEPALSNDLLANLPKDHQNKSREFNNFYDSLRTALKNNNSNFIIGSSGNLINVNYNLTLNFLANFTSEDFYSFHTYAYAPSFDLAINKSINSILSNCSEYLVNCSNVYISEFNFGGGEGVLIKNQSLREEEYGMQVGLVYEEVLNNYNENVSLIFFEYGVAYDYTNTSCYPEYPNRFAMVSEAGLNNETHPIYYPPYNVTKNFATYHSAGSMVVRSESNLSVKVVASKKNNQSITLINTGENTTVALQIDNNSSNSIKDLETGEIYTIINGQVNFEVDQYEIKYLVDYEENETEIPEQPTPTPPEEDSSGGGGGSSSYIPTNPIIANTSTGDTSIEETKQAESTEKPSIEEEKQENESQAETGKTVGTGRAILGDIGNIPVFWKILVIFLIVGITVISLTIWHWVRRPGSP